MTVFVIDEFDFVDVVGEPHLSGVVTVRSGNLDSLLPLRMFCPEPPFQPLDGLFNYAVHVPMMGFKLSPFSSMLTPESIEELEYPISPTSLLLRWQAIRVDEGHSNCSCDSTLSSLEEEENESEIGCLESGAGYVWHEDAMALAIALEDEGWRNISIFPCYREIGALKVSSLVRGQIETFEPDAGESDDEFEGPPSFGDIFGGDA